MVPKSKLNKMFYLEEGSAPTPTGPHPTPVGNWPHGVWFIPPAFFPETSRWMYIFVSLSFCLRVRLCLLSLLFSLTIYPKVTPHKFIWCFLGQVYTIPCFLHILHLDLWCIWSLFLWMVWSGDLVLSCSKRLPSYPVYGKGDFFPPVVSATFMIQSLGLVWTVSFFH